MGFPGETVRKSTRCFTSVPLIGSSFTKLLSACCLAGQLLVLPSIAMAGSSIKVTAPDIWFYFMEPIWRNLFNWPPSDYGDLVQGQRWRQVLSHLSVFQFSEKYALHGDAHQIGSLITLLQAAHVKIALQGVALVATQTCGLGVESYGTPDETELAARRLTSLGGTISYVVFDEPLLFGHFFTRGPKTVGCKLSIDRIVREVVRHKQELEKIAPGIQMGDSEPFGLDRISTADWISALQQWISTYKISSGGDWSFIQADVVWSKSNWQEQLLSALPIMRDRKIPVGVFYTGSPNEGNNHEWAQTIYEEVLSIKRLELQFNQSIFASWTDIPRQFLPEADHDAVTGVMLDYIKNKK